MKKLYWKKQSVWSLILLLVVSISSCKDEKNYYDPNWERPHCEFTFDTETTTSLEVAYENTGIPAAVYFEVYDEMPVETKGTVYVKKEGIEPLYSSYTNSDGTFSGEIQLPAYLQTVYIYTPAFFAQTLITANVENGRITATDGAMKTAQNIMKGTRAGSTSKTYTCQAVTKDNWKTWLGEYNESNGEITGFYTQATSTPTKTTLWEDDFSTEKSGYTKHNATVSGGEIKMEAKLTNLAYFSKRLTWNGSIDKITVSFKMKKTKNGYGTTAVTVSAPGNDSKKFSTDSFSFSTQTYTISNPTSGMEIKFTGPYSLQNNRDLTIDDLVITGESTTQSGQKWYPGYAFTDETSPMYITPSTTSMLLTAHQSVININKTCPEIYRAATDMLVNEPAEVVISLLGGNTCWNSSLGYYYYQEGHAPSSLSQANVILLFPNTQDGLYTHSAGITESARTKGVERGTCVQLKYYPNIATGSKAGETTTFPANTRIGFVLACNTWTNRQNVFSCLNDSPYRATTSKGLSINTSGNAFTSGGSGINDPRRAAIYRYDDYVLFSFEDHQDDQNYSDVVFTLRSNPVEAITDIVKVDEIKTPFYKYKGIYGFEDIWPTEGDYDMNDLLVKCASEGELTHYVTTQTSVGSGGTTSTVTHTSEQELTKEAFILKTFSNRADYTDGLACILDLPAETSIQTINYYIKPKDANEFETYTPAAEWNKEAIYNQHGSFEYNGYGNGQYNIVRLTDNVKDNLGAEYKIEIVYNKDSHINKNTRSDIRPFMYIHAGKGTLQEYYEVHIPLEAPTNNVTKTWWSKNADASRPASIVIDGSGRGEFYVRANNLDNYLFGPWYPFAIFLAGATETDLHKLLDPDNESIPISKLYPHYEDWVQNNGTSYTDWYKD